METDKRVPKEKRDEYAVIAEEKLEERNPSYGTKVQNELILPMETLFVQPDTYYLYRDIMIYNGALENQLKPVRIIDTPKKEKFFFFFLIMKIEL